MSRWGCSHRVKYSQDWLAEECGYELTPEGGTTKRVDEQRNVATPATLGRNPFGVVHVTPPSPRVAEYSNPGLSDATSSGLLTSRHRHPE